ncbi:MAG TPA: ABC transporter ATP-binding protein [Bacillota bacterium]|mgnify:CR=1 FL=1|nr:ABC transporter ATP-binding protein [Clostridiales bacterium]HPT85627.1 ABC transporter ATP-binding protein [Bacillota bacterium]
MRICFKYIKRHLLPFICGILCVCCEAVCDLLGPTFMSRIINEGIRGGDNGKVVRWGVFMLLVTGAGAFFAVSRNVLASRVSQKVGEELRGDLFAKIMSIAEFETDRLEPGSLITRMTSDTQQVTQFINGIMRIFLKAPVVCVGSMVLAAMLNLKLSLIIYGVVIVVMAVIFISMKLSYPLYSKLQAATDRLNSVVQEYLMGIRPIKAFGTYREEEAKFAGANDSLYKASFTAQLVITLTSPIMTLAVGAGTVMVLAIGGSMFEAGAASPGDISAFIIYMSQILTSLTTITNIFNTFVRTKASTERISEVIKSKDDFTGGKITDIKFETLEFRNVKFTYPTAALGGKARPALDGISFKVSRGETLAIIGPTGSGKSTICALLLRFYDADSGEILIDGRPISDYNVEALRNAIGYVSQKPMLFSGTVEENLRFGRENASNEELDKAIKDAQADFIYEKPEGLMTVLGSGGVNLSGGQKQRVAIARALVKKAPALVLDDATSALDALTEAKVREALKRDADSRLTINITQRCASARFADKILVLEDGVQAGFGKHDELMKNCRVYIDIYKSQIEGSHGEEKAE